MSDKLRQALETCITTLEILQDEATDFPATISGALIEARAALAEPAPTLTDEQILSLLWPITDYILLIQCREDVLAAGRAIERAVRSTT